MPDTKVTAYALELWIESAFCASGMPTKDARDCASMLVQTSLWGIDSHGIARVPHYLNRISHGSISVKSPIQFDKTGAATGQLNGGHGMGFVVCKRAMEHAIELAKNSGAGVVGISNSTHCGAIGLYTRQAAQSGMIGIAFTHSDAFVVPHGGTKPFFGTNPISIAIPTENSTRPFCVDMATSIVPWNRIMNARRENRSLPLGYGVDSEGKDTCDPHAISAVKPAAEHKGYALAFAIDMLCGPLNGMAFGPNITPMYSALEQHRKLGSLVIAIDPGRFAGGALLAAAITAAITQLKSQNTEILSPGEPEYQMEKQRTNEGIPIDAGLMKEFLTWSNRLGIEPLS